MFYDNAPSALRLCNRKMGARYNSALSDGQQDVVDGRYFFTKSVPTTKKRR